MCCAAQEKVSFCDDVSDFEISHHEIAQIFAKINDRRRRRGNNN